ncbi:serine hydrolase [Streptomyces sp. ST2-7A]|uniref:serine hydrolase domain-containing protein n=1 Tax=Streptomyces sp. ST2-7A TaxID=2907214 RepID=UPI001F2DC447|nr:serine hydrolase domain-containing protein [Streptomyces sp. ST2-7A]MCE7079442.1 beta-lactamase family protein [Streptomyces sp. ST2-7A]
MTEPSFPRSATGPAAPRVPGAADSSPPLPTTERALYHRLAVAQAEGRAPSVIAAVVRDGVPVWCAGRGEVAGEPPGPGTQYRIGSITKTFVAILVMRLRAEGLISFDDRLDRYLEVPAGGQARIAELLCHAGGLAAEPRGPWWERTEGSLRPELPDLFGERPMRHSPGRRHHYSNTGYALLGALVERLRGRSWYEALRAEVLHPLGMSDTTLLPRAPHAEGWAVHPHADVVQPEPAVDTGRMAPAGQLWSTAADLCRFAAFLVAGDDRVLGAADLEEMRRPAVPAEARDRDTGYGWGLQVLHHRGRTLTGHSGSMPGFVAGLWASPSERLAAVALTNAGSGLSAPTLAADLITLFAEHEPVLPEPWRPMPEADPALVAAAGVWYWGAAPHLLRVRAGRELELAPAEGAGRGSRFRPSADGTWTGLEGYFAGETLRIGAEVDGTVPGSRGPDHLDIGTFVFTRVPYDPAAPVPGGTDPRGWLGERDGARDGDRGTRPGDRPADRSH